MGAGAGSVLTADERRRLELVLEGVQRGESVAELMAVMLAALDEHLGLDDTVFMLALAGENRPYTGLKYGTPPHVLEEYMERWANLDALGSEPALALYERRGWATTTEVYPYLDAGRRRHVDDFLRAFTARTSSRSGSPPGPARRT